MARSSPKAQNLDSQESAPTPSQPLPPDPVSLVDPVSRVPQAALSEDIVIGDVAISAVRTPEPQPVVEYGDNGSITIR